MSTTTTNFSLVKPELTDAVDITATNGNWDTIDTQLKTISDASKKAGNITSGVLPIERGGTGAETAAKAVENIGAAPAVHEHDFLDTYTGDGRMSFGVSDNGSWTRTLRADGEGGYKRAEYIYLHRDGLKVTTYNEDGLYTSTLYSTTNKPTPSDIKAAPETHSHGAGDITSGTLPITVGGTGVTENPSVLVNLGSTSAAGIFAASPRPGVTGTLPIARGGTGATTAAAALTKLGLTATATELNYMDGVTAKVQTQLNSKVDKSGDAMTGSITFNNTDSYHALHKYRVVNSTTYGVNIGCGVLGGEGIASIEARKGNATTSPLVGRLEIGTRGVSFVDANDKRTYLHSTGLSSASVE